jgi:branched-chain amino acid transport system ATP-binding protein
MKNAILEIEGAGVAYGRATVVNGVSLKVERGQIVTVIGANGAGKSTLLNAVMGALPLVAGRVRFDGADLGRMGVEERVERGLCLSPERRELFSTMTVADNLALGGFRVPRAVARATLDEVYGRFPRLAERRDQFAGTMSGGERQMLAMGRALMSQPRLLMLDEPSLGLAPRIVADIFRIILDLRASGVSILLVEQNARAALAAADEAHVMELGAVSVSGRASELAQDDRIVRSYLGFH